MGSRTLERASFLARFVAFSIDYFLVLAAAWMCMRLLAPMLPLQGASLPELLAVGFAVWLTLFIGYHVLLSLGESSTLGKRIVGLRIYTQDGYPLPFGASVIRACAYLLSGLAGGLGYLWALFHPDALAWHDLLAGTTVLEERPGTTRSRIVVALSGAGFAAVWAVHLLWPVAAPRYYQNRIVANAATGLKALGLYEQMHLEKTGRYTRDIWKLGRLSGNEREFATLLGQTVDLASLRIEADARSCLIRARALDAARTVLEYRCPTTEVRAPGVGPPSPVK